MLQKSENFLRVNHFPFGTTMKWTQIKTVKDVSKGSPSEVFIMFAQVTICISEWLYIKKCLKCWKLNIFSPSEIYCSVLLFSHSFFLLPLLRDWNFLKDKKNFFAKIKKKKRLTKNIFTISMFSKFEKTTLR